MSNHNKPLSTIFGCSGLVLTEAERKFFTDVNPFGFILFARNCDNPEQIKDLVTQLTSCCAEEHVPILIDQEGGRVARLKPPHWPSFPRASAYGDVYDQDPKLGVEAAYLGGQLIAHELYELGITVDCAPVLDVPQPGADPIVGDRAFGQTVLVITTLAKSFMEGLMSGGVAPVIKHIPGHGRALVDSHEKLPHVDASIDDLEATDFAPFKVLHFAPWAMTAHVVYSALDAEHPATLSPKIIEQTIRRHIGFRGILVSDDLSMKALTGDFTDRTKAALSAGCDIALHCNGDLTEMTAVAEGAGPMSRASWARYKMGEIHRRGAKRDFDVKAVRMRYDAILNADT